MFDNRHCIETDYILLVKETNKIIEEILKSNGTCKSELDKYLALISIFDLEFLKH